MIRAILVNGAIQPVDSLPEDWADGQELSVEPIEPKQEPTVDDFERWYQEFDRLCAASDPEDDERLRVALAKAHEQAKSMVRRQMGLE